MLRSIAKEDNIQKNYSNYKKAIDELYNYK